MVSICYTIMLLIRGAAYIIVNCSPSRGLWNKIRFCAVSTDIGGSLFSCSFVSQRSNVTI